jgi:hypothetical protein
VLEELGLAPAGEEAAAGHWLGLVRSWRAAAYFGRRRAVSAADAYCPDLN